jgi:hypothetical protein
VSPGTDHEGEVELDLRSLTKGGTGTILVLVVTLSPEFAALPGTDRADPALPPPITKCAPKD